jgi:hypothetical protein
MSDTEYVSGAPADSASGSPMSEARRFREVRDEEQRPGQAADIVRSMVRELPLLALASAFLVGVLVGRRR